MLSFRRYIGEADPLNVDNDRRIYGVGVKRKEQAKMCIRFEYRTRLIYDMLWERLQRVTDLWIDNYIVDSIGLETREVDDIWNIHQSETGHSYARRMSAQNETATVETWRACGNRMASMTNVTYWSGSVGADRTQLGGLTRLIIESYGWEPVGMVEYGKTICVEEWFGIVESRAGMFIKDK